MRNRWTDRWCGQGHGVSGPAHLPLVPTSTWHLSFASPLSSWPLNSLYSSLWLDCLTPVSWPAESSSRTQIRCHLLPTPRCAPVHSSYHVFLSLHWSSSVEISQMPICLSHWTGDHLLDPWAQSWRSDRIMLYLACRTWAHMVFFNFCIHGQKLKIKRFRIKIQISGFPYQIRNPATYMHFSNLVAEQSLAFPFLHSPHHVLLSLQENLVSEPFVGTLAVLFFSYSGLKERVKYLPLFLPHTWPTSLIYLTRLEPVGTWAFHPCTRLGAPWKQTWCFVHLCGSNSLAQSRSPINAS